MACNHCAAKPQHDLDERERELRRLAIADPEVHIQGVRLLGVGHSWPIPEVLTRPGAPKFNGYPRACLTCGVVYFPRKD